MYDVCVGWCVSAAVGTPNQGYGRVVKDIARNDQEHIAPTMM